LTILVMVLLALVDGVVTVQTFGLDGSPGGSELRMLVVACDDGDVEWYQRFQFVLKRMGVNAHVDLLYVGRSSSGSVEARKLLSDLYALKRYDIVLIPNLRSWLAYGGSLSSFEVETLKYYVYMGHVLVLGFYTLAEGWSPCLEELTGLRLVRVMFPARDGSDFDIVYGDMVIRYNDTLGVVVVQPATAGSVATFACGLPAVLANSYGGGYVLVFTYNIVGGGLDSRSWYANLRLVAQLTVRYAGYTHRMLLPIHIELTLLARDVLDLLFHWPPLWIPIGYGFLLLLTRLCLLPWSLRVAVLKPVAAISGIRRGSKLWKVYECMSRLVIVYDRGLKRICGGIYVCYALSYLAAKGLVKKAKLQVDDRVEDVYMLANKVSMVSLMLDDVHRKIVHLVASEPGLTISEIAARLGLDVETVNRHVLELVKAGLAVVVDSGPEYKVYPSLSLSDIMSRNKVEDKEIG